MTNIIRKETEFAGKKLILETGELAPQADMAVRVQYGDTVILATVVSSGLNTELDYFPLSVNYEEKLFSSGTIKSSRFMKRDGRPSDEGIVRRRLIDHAIRPLFPQDEGFKDNVQVAIYLLSLDEEADPMFASMIAASAALHASNIPWSGPMTSARVGYINEEYVLNPTIAQMHEESDLDLLVSFVGDEKRFLALEAEANLLPEEVILGAIKHANDNIDPLLQVIKDFAEEVNPGIKKYEFESQLPSEELMTAASDLLKDRIVELVGAGLEKDEMKAKAKELKDEMYKAFEGQFKKDDMGNAFYLLQKDAMKHLILDEDKRTDGRGSEEIRPLSGKVDVLPKVHGSALFTRGLTQVMNVVTLGGLSEAMIVQDVYGERTKNFLHHYQFPPFSVGETGRMGGVGGREIGHGMLAERALAPVIPSKQDWAYMTLIHSETLSSNGSSSMAATCAGCLALMAAGVPLKEMVAGIGIGLITNDDFSKYKLLTDIQGLEDGSGYMDFKMTGSRTGVTAIQVDIKAKGLGMEMLPEILKRSHDARMKVLDVMESVIGAPRAEVNENAPKVASTQIKPEQIGKVIGSGGKVIKQIQEDTETVVSIDEDGTVSVTGQDKEGVLKAKEIIEGITREVKAGEIFDGVVEELAPYGAFVEFLPGKTGLLHVSEVSDDFVDDVVYYLKAGQDVKVKVLEVSRDGKYSLSLKALEGNAATRLEGSPENKGPQSRPSGGNSGGRDRGGRGGRRPRR